MRLRNALIAVSLAAAIALTPGCCTVCPPAIGQSGDAGNGGAGGPWLKPGVVRVERDGMTIGYMSIDPSNSKQQNWILNGTESLPLNVAVDGQLCFVFLNASKYTAAQLCADPQYGGSLSSPKQWTMLFDHWGGEECPP